MAGERKCGSCVKRSENRVAVARLTLRARAFRRRNQKCSICLRFQSERFAYAAANNDTIKSINMNRASVSHRVARGIFANLRIRIRHPFISSGARSPPHFHAHFSLISGCKPPMIERRTANSTPCVPRCSRSAQTDHEPAE